MKQIVLIACLLALEFSLISQTSDFGERVKPIEIDSEVLKESREILIFSPNFESGSSLKYPTLYVLDGRENMLLTMGIVSNLVRANVIPEVNIVGINNYDYNRTKDLTPNTSDGNNDFGGADRFIEFIESEVFELAKMELASNDFRVLIGHSLGGLFATYSLTKNDNLFDAYIQVGGSYWFDDEKVVSEFLKINSAVLNQKRLYFSLSNEVDSKKGFNQLKSALAGRDNIHFDEFSGSDHVTGLTPALFNGLQFVFGQWKGWDELYATNNFEGIKSKVSQLAEHYKMDVIPLATALAPYARGLTSEQKFERSIEILSYLERFHPEHIMVLNYLGEAYQKKGNDAKAREVYERSLKVAESKKSPMVRWIKARLNELKD